METERNFKINITARLSIKEHELTKKVVDTKKDDLGTFKYNSLSHFVRCAVIKLLREESKSSTKPEEKRQDKG